mmetsp:Transcript_13783/g.22156  ORF Transcript_13783/g.22156 Transcript_13783/m.22156 type:complete len:232 (-) Transcript_13783:2034-2729(-)
MKASSSLSFATFGSMGSSSDMLLEDVLPSSSSRFFSSSLPLLSSSCWSFSLSSKSPQSSIPSGSSSISTGPSAASSMSFIANESTNASSSSSVSHAASYSSKDLPPPSTSAASAASNASSSAASQPSSLSLSLFGFRSTSLLLFLLMPLISSRRALSMKNLWKNSSCSLISVFSKKLGSLTGSSSRARSLFIRRLLEVATVPPACCCLKSFSRDLGLRYANLSRKGARPKS